MKIEVTNSLSRVWGTDGELKGLDELTSYPVEGAKFSDAYRNGWWDGREHLMRKSRKGDYHIIPSGVLSEVRDEFPGVEFVDARRKPKLGLWKADWLVHPLRDYQLDACKAAVKDRGVFTGKGILNLPIRSGKTRTAAAIARMLGAKTLFAVPSQLLLGQTVKAFKECYGDGFPIGVIGDGECNTEELITVATVQSLMAGMASKKRAPQFLELMHTVDLLYVDEAHHLDGPEWRNVAIMCDAFYKIGLSATVFVSRMRENQSSSIWMKAATGGILYRVSMGRLIKAGQLMTPHVTFIRFHHHIANKKMSWQRVQSECVVNCRPRNKVIADTAVKCAAEGKRVLIDTGRIEQMKEIHGFISAMGVNVEMISGKTQSSRRWEIIKSFQEGTVQVIVGTVFGEGVDIPELEVVINAEGQKSETSAIQRLRNCTPSICKANEVQVYDILDIGQKHLESHANARLRLYRGMRGFKVEVI